MNWTAVGIRDYVNLKGVEIVIVLICWVVTTVVYSY